METIEKAAIRVTHKYHTELYQDDRLVITIDRPGRHHTIINGLASIGMGLSKASQGAEQGFVTSEGRFVDRVEGLAIAKAANQIKHKNGNSSELYSEDIW